MSETITDDMARAPLAAFDKATEGNEADYECSPALYTRNLNAMKAALEAFHCSLLHSYKEMGRRVETAEKDLHAAKLVAENFCRSGREARNSLRFIADQPCQQRAEGSSEDFACTETGACATEWCLPCYASAALGEGPHACPTCDSLSRKVGELTELLKECRPLLPKHTSSKETRPGISEWFDLHAPLKARIDSILSSPSESDG